MLAGDGGQLVGDGERSDGDGEPLGTGLEQALAIAYRYLNRRERTEAEMRTRLERGGVDPPDVEPAIATLLEHGYLDDARFARLFAEDKRELEQWGSDRIRRALRERGVSSDLVDEALAAHRGDTEIERALAVLRQRFPAPIEGASLRRHAAGTTILLANEWPTGHKNTQQTTYILDSGLSADGKHHRATWSLQTRLRPRNVAAD
jgi:regulatory protein